MQALIPAASRIAEALVRRGETVAVAESSSGGLISSALLAVPGASAYFQGGGVVYTRAAGRGLLEISREDVVGLRSSSEPYAVFLARRVKGRLRSDWGVSETGAAGPSGNPYGDAAGHTCVAVSGALERSFTLETGRTERTGNMLAFAAEALRLFEAVLAEAPGPRR